MSHAILRKGDSGEEVGELGALLVRRGFLDAAGDVFDTEVQRAVKGFQARHVDSRGRPLVVDGVVGPLTWWALEHPDNSAVLATPQAEAWLTLPASGGSARGRFALAAALQEMAAGAREVGGNNAGPWVGKYLDGIVAPPANWCAAFVSWCFAQHPEGPPFRYSLGARDIREQFRRRGWTYQSGDGTTPEAGDIVVWWRGQPEGWMGHIGLVHHCEHGILYTVEGNKGGFPAPVRLFDYVIGRIVRLLGFGRVP